MWRPWALELHLQSELADASAAKLAALEGDRGSVARAYSDRLAFLATELAAARYTLADIARHVIGHHLSQETRVRIACR